MYLPPLKAIEAFEAAAKHLNFTRAGAELNLTSAAISQRVAALEGALGYELFQRQGPTLTLTDSGRICLPVLNQAMRQMRDAIGSLQDMTQNSVLTIKVSPSFAQKWLIPRLGRFNLRHPEIDLRIWSTTDRVRINEGELCLAIYYGIDPSTGLAGNLALDYLFQEDIFPVCSPALVGAESLKKLDDLRNVTLLHDDTMNSMQLFPNWRRWCDEFEMKDIDTNHGPRFVVSSTTIQAAMEGQGVSLGRGALVRDDIVEGRLIKPFSETYPVAFEYFFVYPKFLAQRSNVKLFREWLLEEATLHNDKHQAG